MHSCEESSSKPRAILSLRPFKTKIRCEVAQMLPINGVSLESDFEISEALEGYFSSV